MHPSPEYLTHAVSNLLRSDVAMRDAIIDAPGNKSLRGEMQSRIKRLQVESVSVSRYVLFFVFF